MNYTQIVKIETGKFFKTFIRGNSPRKIPQKRTSAKLNLAKNFPVNSIPEKN